MNHQDFNTAVKINHKLVSPLLTLNQETIETTTEQSPIIYDQNYQTEDLSTSLETNSEINITKSAEFPIVSVLSENIVRKNTKLEPVLNIESANPLYAPEEFSYIQDPDIHPNTIDHGDHDDDDDVDYVDDGEDDADILGESPVIIENFENLRHINIELTKDNDEYNSREKDYIQFNSKCKDFEEVGFCGFSESYPVERISWLLQNCSSLLSSFQAVVPDELDRLGDNSESVITSEKDEDRPWSWRVYAYKKRQACHSEVSLIRPTYAVDTTGWSLLLLLLVVSVVLMLVVVLVLMVVVLMVIFSNISSAGEPQLIIQTDSIVQRVPVDVCSSPGSPCGGLEQCSLRSLCVQRYTYHYLLASQPGQLQHCPAIRAFKLPTACVCHAQVDSSRFGDKLV